MPLTTHDELLFLPCRAGALEHDVATHRALARRLAAVLGCVYRGDFDPAAARATSAYLVPNDTITSLEGARRLGIRGADDLYGGVVPFAFVATKTISHGLVGPDARAPEGWQAEFAQRVRDVVLPGYSAFSLVDARTAALRLLGEGPVRIKLASGLGGSGQTVARDAAQLDAQLGALARADVERHGLVVERDLDAVRSYSVGLLRIGPMRVGYVGTQRTTQNARGCAVYGGSSLTFVRGGLDALEQAAGGDDELRRAVALARAYHDAALDCFAGMFASRVNYDVAQGRDARGRECAGVLEQSWRIGGASGAEIVALQSLRDDPSVQTVRASMVEAYGDGVAVPAGATLYFSGVDPQIGAITKYAMLHEHADARTDG
jgi:hypothetical protein